MAGRVATRARARETLTPRPSLPTPQDARKDEAIMRTFKQVVKSFREVFADLVPKGSATMKLVTMDGEEGVRSGRSRATAFERAVT